jgi:hypothetical protein
MTLLDKDFGEGTRQIYYKGIEFIVTLYPHKCFIPTNRLAQMHIECNGISVDPAHLITPELWHDEKAIEIVVYDLAKFLY